MPLKRTYSTSTTIVPAAGYQQTKKRRIPLKKRARVMYPASGTVGRPRPFPIRMVASLRYCTTVSVTNSLTPIGNLNFSCNSIYDPDVSGAGHQPYGHDTYADIYNQYTVLKSRLKVTPTFNGSNTPMTYGVGIEASTLAAGANDVWAERPTYQVRGCNQPYSMLGQQPLVCYWDRNKRFPHNDTYRDLSAPFGANPTEIEIFNIVVQRADATTALGTVYMFVEIDYLVEMYEPKDLGSS